MFVTLLLIASAFLGAGSVGIFKGAYPAGRSLLILGMALNIAALIVRGYVNGGWYPDQMASETYLLPIFLALIMLGIMRVRQYAAARLLSAPLVLIVLIVLATMSPGIVSVLRMRTLWAPFFFVTEAWACALFIAAGTLALPGVWREDLKGALQTCAAWGFIVFSFSQVVGAIWSYLGWSSPFSWNDRHLISTALWCLYAAVLHARVAGVSVRTSRYCAVLGLIPTLYLCCFYSVVDALTRLKGGLG